MASSGGLVRHVLLAFLMALAGYIGFFSLDQHLRRRKGPWQVTFTTNGAGDASLLINQPGLDVRDVRVVLTNESVSNRPTTVRFDSPQKPVPFGRVKFEDLTYLPGTVTFDLFGHEIELLPRTLILNRREHRWRSAETIRLTPDQKLITNR